MYKRDCQIVSSVYEAIGRGVEHGEDNIICDVLTINPNDAEDFIEKSRLAEEKKGVYITGTLDKRSAEVRSDRFQRQYASAMRNGEWELNGEAIIISEEGIILSGITRLRACIESKSSFETFVVRNVVFDSVYSVNEKLLRSASDTQYCALAGSGQLSDDKEERKEANSVFFARMMNMILRCSDGVWKKETLTIPNSQIGLTASFYFHEMKSIKDEMEDIICQNNYERREHSHNFTKPAQAALVFLLSKSNKRLAFNFVLGLICSNAPMSGLFDKLMNGIIEKTKGKREENDTFGKLINAWNVFLSSGEANYKNTSTSSTEIKISGWPTNFEIEVKKHTRNKNSELRNSIEYKYAVITITPQMAEEALNNFNGANRVKRGWHYKKLTDLTKKGQWVVNGQSIKFGKTADGQVVLLDGQHRLQAISDSGVNVESLVIVGLDAELFPYLDTANHERGLKSVLKKMGISRSEALSPATTAIYDVINGAGAAKRLSLRDLKDFCLNMQLPDRRDEMSGFLQGTSRNKDALFTNSLILAFYAITYHDQDYGKISDEIVSPQKNYLMLIQGLIQINDKVLGNISVNTNTDWFNTATRVVNFNKMPWNQMRMASLLLQKASTKDGSVAREPNSVKNLRMILDGWMLYKRGKVKNSAARLAEDNGNIYVTKWSKENDLPAFVKAQVEWIDEALK